MKEFHSIKTNQDARKAFSVLFQRVRSAAETQDFTQMDQIIEEVTGDAEGVHSILLVGALRLTAIHRSRLASWREAVERVAAALVERGEQPEEILRGLQ